VFGDFDSLAWDLGNPDGNVLDNPGPFNSALVDVLPGRPMEPVFHPMKGPLMTLSLRGMANHGPMHWRGDRTGGNDAPSAQPDSGSFDERAAFKKFEVAFPDLLGRNATIPAANMDAFTEFILQVKYPPSPIRRLDNALTADQQVGSQLLANVNCGIPACLDGNCPVLSCTSCHVLDPGANPGSAAPGFFGTDGRSSFDFTPQLIKTPHFRNLYQKVGMFGMAENAGILGGDFGPKGDQVRGFGYTHDGAIDTVLRFSHGLSFSVLFTGEGNGGIPTGPEGEIQRQQLTDFMLAFPSDFAPIVGQQITLKASSPPAVVSRVDLLRQRADAGDCDLVAKAALLDAESGFMYAGAGMFRTDRRAQPAITDEALRLVVTSLGRAVTYTCVPPGSGQRIGVDRDGDGFWDGDERDARSDPADPLSTP
jgi:hypothetical protein